MTAGAQRHVRGAARRHRPRLGGRRGLRLRDQLLRRGARRPDHPVPRGGADLRRLGRWQRHRRSRAVARHPGGGRSRAQDRAAGDDPARLRVPATVARSWRRCTPAGSTTTGSRQLPPVVFAAAARRRRHRALGSSTGRPMRSWRWRRTAIRRLRMTRARCRCRARRRDLPQRRRGLLRPHPRRRRRSGPRGDDHRPQRSAGHRRRADRAGPRRRHASGARPRSRCLDPRAARRPHSRADGRSDRWRRSSSIRSPRSSATT